MRFFLFVVASFLFSASVALAEETDVWAGSYVEMQFSRGLGTHSLDYYGFGHQLSIYDFGLGNADTLHALGFGHRVEIMTSRVYLGAELTARFGTVSGVEVETYSPMPLSTELSFSARTLVTAALQVGYSPTPELLVYGEVGLVAADLQVSLTGEFLDETTGTSLRGWAPGKYLAIGVSRQLRDGWFLGAELQRFSFSVEEHLSFWGEADHGSLRAAAGITQLAVVFGRKF